VLTLRSAASLLAQADSLVALRAVTNAMGFTGHHVMSVDSQRELGVDHLVTNAELSRGPGRLRCLSATLRPHAGAVVSADARELTRRLCAAIVLRAPSRDWCVATIDAAGTTVAIATISPQPLGPRITALRVDRQRVVDSDADTLRSLTEITEPDGSLRHARFVDILGRDALSHGSIAQSTTRCNNSATPPPEPPRPPNGANWRCCAHHDASSWRSLKPRAGSITIGNSCSITPPLDSNSAANFMNGSLSHSSSER
jgi:hypothetical protein